MTDNSDHWLPWASKGVGLFLFLFATFVGLGAQRLGLSLSVAVGVVMGIPIILLLMFADLVTNIFGKQAGLFRAGGRPEWAFHFDSLFQG